MIELTRNELRIVNHVRKKGATTKSDLADTLGIPNVVVAESVLSLSLRGILKLNNPDTPFWVILPGSVDPFSDDKK